MLKSGADSQNFYSKQKLNLTQNLETRLQPTGGMALEVLLLEMMPAWPTKTQRTKVKHWRLQRSTALYGKSQTMRDVVIGDRKVSICGFLLSDCHVSAKDEWEVEM